MCTSCESVHMWQSEFVKRIECSIAIGAYLHVGLLALNKKTVAFNAARAHASSLTKLTHKSHDVFLYHGIRYLVSESAVRLLCTEENVPLQLPL